MVLAQVRGAGAQDSCGSASRAVGGVQVDLAPPGNFVDLCAEDAALCRKLTSENPASVSTLGYFVLPEEWKAYKQKPQGFTRYLIVQLSATMTPEKLPVFRQFVHSRQGSVPDAAALASTLASRGRVQLGIIDETSDSISYGQVAKVAPAAMPSLPPTTLASVNSAIIVRGHVLSLYAYAEVKDMDGVEPLEALSQTWLSCVRKKNEIGK